MSNYTGVVSKIFPPSNWGTHSFGLRGEKGYYNLGKVPPMFSEGQTISFYGNPGKRAGNVDVTPESVTIVTEQPVEHSVANGARRSAEVVTKDKYWENREARDEVTQKRIEIQAARNAAIELYAAMETVEEPEAFINKWVDIFLANNEARLGN